MTKTARVNVRTAINKATIRHEKRDGRDVIVVPSVTLPDGIVMNKVRYPAEVIANSYKSLEGTPAPLGHPTGSDGSFIPASNPLGLVKGFIGAWNENVRRENGRVFLDKVIDVEHASQLDGGKRVLNAIEKGKPIHTSTGLFCEMSAVENSTDGAEWEVSSMVFDHDAILLDEDGAATPSQGVGMLVNKATDASGKAVEVINSSWVEDAERELDWAADYAVRAAEKMARAPMLETIKKALIEAVLGKKTEAPETSTNKGEQAMNEAQFNDLSGKLDKVAESLSGMGDVIAQAVANAVKPVADAFAAQNAAAEAAAAAAKEVLVNKVVDAKILTKEIADVTPVETLKALANTITEKPKAAFMLNRGHSAPVSGEGDASAFKIPQAE